MKRPLLVGVVFYIIGILVSNILGHNIIAIILMTLITINVLLIMYRRYRSIACIAFLLLYFAGYANCYYRMKPKDLMAENIANNRSRATINGQVINILPCDYMTKSIISVNSITSGDLSTNKKLRIVCYVDKDIHIGDYVTASGYLSKPKKPTNPGQFNEYLYYKINLLEYKMYGSIESIDNNNVDYRTVLSNVRSQLSNIFDDILPDKQSGIVKTMILGDKTDLDKTVKETYQKAGIAHVLAISGLHITIIAGMLFGLFKILRLSQRASSLLTITMVVSYCVMTGSSVSTVRATLMSCIVLFSFVVFRKPDIITSVALAAFLLLVRQPLYLWDVGFLLSFVAVLGLIYITPLFDKIYFINRKIRMVFGASFAATISIVPIVAYYFYSIPVYSVLINIVIVPLVSIVLIVGLGGAIVGLFSLALARFFIGIVYYILLFYEKVCNFSLWLPYSTLLVGRPSIVFIILYYISLIMAVLYFNMPKKKRKKFTDIMLGYVIIAVLILLISKERGMNVVFLDVGQGDGMVVHTPNGKTLVIDGGGDPAKYPLRDNTGLTVMLPYLQYKGIAKIDAMLLSHPHADHIIGLIELLDNVSIDEIYIADIEAQQCELLDTFLNKAKENNVKIIDTCDNQVDIDNELDDKYGVDFTYLSPYDDIDYENVNESSMVVGIKYKDVNILFTGDIEKNTEKRLVKDNLNVYNVLKVPHHGSKTSSTKEFINTVNPIIGIVSCGGQQSKYKHPHKEVIDRYDDKNIDIYNTSVDGAVTLKTNGKIIKMHRFNR